MMSYLHDWETLSVALETNVSPVVQLLRAFWNDPALSEGAYFEVLGYLARNAAGEAPATHAALVAARRLSESSENARVAVDFQRDRCAEAVRALRFGAGDDCSENPLVALIAGREALEGLRTLSLLLPFHDPSTATRADVCALSNATESAIQEVDASVDRFDLITKLETELRNELSQPQYLHLKPLAQLHPDDWWHAASLRAHRRVRKALVRAAEKLRDDFEHLSKWVVNLRPAQWSNLAYAQRMHDEFVVHIDASYRPRHYNSPTASRVLRILWDATSVLFKELSSRQARGELALVLASNATLAMTLYDRVIGATLPGARVPNDLQRLGWTANAWRVARLLQHENGIAVVNAFQRHTWWRSPQRLGLEHPEAVAAGCVACAWFLGQTGYRRDAELWLRRAHDFVRSTPPRLRAKRLAPIATAYIDLSALYLQAPEDPDRCCELATQAMVIADECSEAVSPERPGFDVSLRGRAMMNRASALDLKGDFLGAMAERSAALDHIERATAGVKSLPANLLETKWQLHFGLGNVDAAATDMLKHIVAARKRGEHEIADNVALGRANMLLEYGYQEAALEALWRLASRDPSSSAVSRARALIKSVDRSTSGPELWALEATAQALATEARRATGTDVAKTLTERALAANDRLLQLNPEDLVALTRRAQLLIRRGATGDYIEASAILDRLSNDDAYVLFCRGHLAYRERNFPAAASWLREAYELAPRAETAAFLANALTRAHQLPAALQAIEAHHSVEDDAPLLDARGVLEASRGNYVAAWESFEQAFVAVSSMRADETVTAEFDRPARRIAMIKRMAALAPQVAATNRSLIDRFLRRDPDISHRFIHTCVSRLAFGPALRESIFACSAFPPLRKAVAQYAMGACVYEETMGRPEAIPEIVQRMWNSLELRDNPLLVAELLAGGKSAYRASIRSALDGAIDQTRHNCSRWLHVEDSRFEALTAHIANTVRSSSYYRRTAELVMSHRELGASVELLLQQVRTQIPHVRMRNLVGLELRDVIADIARASDEETHFEGVFQASLLAGPLQVVVSTEDLRLPDVPIYLVDVTPQTVGLVLRCVGEPTECAAVTSDGAVPSLRIAFGDRKWPATLETLVEREGLMHENESTLFVEVECLPGSQLAGPN